MKENNLVFCIQLLFKSIKIILTITWQLLPLCACVSDNKNTLFQFFNQNLQKKICFDYHPPMASNSSIKMIAGAFSLARANASRTSLAPSPINICTSCGPANFKNVDLVWAAQARASNVFPVPGAPYSNTPENKTIFYKKHNYLFE